MIRRYLQDIVLLSLLMTFVLTVGVITSSILDFVLRAYGISESSGLSISLIILIALLISGVILLPQSLLRSVKVLYLQDHTVFEQANNDKAFKSIAKKMGIFIALAFISIIIISLAAIFFRAFSRASGRTSYLIEFLIPLTIGVIIYLLSIAFITWFLVRQLARFLRNLHEPDFRRSLKDHFIMLITTLLEGHLRNHQKPDQSDQRRRSESGHDNQRKKVKK